MSHENGRSRKQGRSPKSHSAAQTISASAEYCKNGMIVWEKSLPEKHYNWPRFWCRQGEDVSLDHQGFVADPTAQISAYSRQPNLKSYADLSHMRHLVFLGSPGIGKSRTLKDAFKLAEAEAKTTGNDVLLVDLKDRSSEDRVIKLIFEDAKFQAWLAGSHTLDLFLDSLDECLLRLTVLDGLLSRELGTRLKQQQVQNATHSSDNTLTENQTVLRQITSSVPSEKELRLGTPEQHVELITSPSTLLRDRLRLRIACRTTDWQTHFRALANTIKEIADPDDIGVYELAGLRQADVLEAARVEGLDVESFLRQVIEVRAVPLAIKPITLEMLLLQAKQNAGKLPSSQRELYERGCKLYCTEPDQNRELHRAPLLDPARRMAVASRIAAVSTFGARSSVWLEKDFGDRASNEVTVTQLSGHHERFKSQDFAVNEGEIRETLKTALFVSAGDQHTTWAHQTYREFLAAWHLFNRGLGLTQVLELILHPTDPERRVVPQLREVAGWLATMIPEVRTDLLKRDPEVLLRSDVASFDEADRESLMVGVLDALEHGRWRISLYEDPLTYKRMYYPGVALLLKTYLHDQKRTPEVRESVIRLIEILDLRKLEDDLFDVVLDDTEPHTIRQSLLYILKRFGSDPKRVRLRPLLSIPAAHDPHDEIRALTLELLWPNHINATELFLHLSKPREQNVLGAYRMFLDHSGYRQETSLWWQLDSEGIRCGLEWATPTTTWAWAGDDLIGAPEGISYLIENAWSNLEYPGMLEALGNFVHARFADRSTIYHDLKLNAESDLRNRIASEDDRRHRLLTYLFRHSKLSVGDIQALQWEGIGHIPLLYDDFAWTIEQLELETNPRMKSKWATLARQFAQSDDFWRNQRYRQLLLITLKKSLPLRKAFNDFLTTIRLDSQIAIEGRESSKRHADMIAKRNEWQAERERQRVQNPKERVVKGLEWLKKKPDNLWAVIREMTLKPDDTHYGNSAVANIQELPGWIAADTETQSAIIAGAKTYLECAAVPSLRIYFAKGSFNISTFTAVQAMQLLWVEQHEYLENLSDSIWQRWAATITTRVLTGSTSRDPEAQKANEHIQEKLAKIASAKAHHEVEKTVLEMVKSDARRHGTVFGHHFEHFLDEPLMDKLCDLLETNKWKPKAIEMLLSTLLAHGSTRAETFAEKCIALPPKPRARQRALAVHAAHAFLRHITQNRWTLVWSLFKQFPAIGQEIVLGHGFGREQRFGNIAAQFSEEVAADLYLWLETYFPRAEDPQYPSGTAHQITARDEVATSRNDVLYNLASRGTHQSIKALERIARAFPDESFGMKRVLMQARETTSLRTWQPLKPEQILEMTRNPQSRFVRSADQLLDVILESLERLQLRLQGETPAALFLWDETSKGKFQPKLEARLSDFMRSHLEIDLKGRGLIFTREPEISPIGYGSVGEKLDILVDVNVPGIGDELDKVGVIIEVKGCWNKDLDTSMQTQLVERYLKDNHARRGLYVVGWYACPQWDTADWKCGATPKNLTLEDVSNQFAEQAKKLSDTGTRVAAVVLNTALR
jgi:hypothetical protein